MFSDQQDTAGFLVQPVDQSQRFSGIQLIFQQLQNIWLARTVRRDRNTAGFIDQQDLVVFKQYVNVVFGHIRCVFF